MARLNQRQDNVVSHGLDALRRKFGAQNRAIAKSHAALEEKVAQMKETTDQLLAENYELRCENLRLKERKDLSIGHVREVLSKKWAEIEMMLFEGQPSILPAPLMVPSIDAVVPESQGNNIDKITRRKRNSSVDGVNRSFEETAVSDEPPAIELVVEERNTSCMTEDSIPEEDETPYEEENRPQKRAETILLELEKTARREATVESRGVVAPKAEEKSAVQPDVIIPVQEKQIPAIPVEEKHNAVSSVQKKQNAVKSEQEKQNAANTVPEQQKTSNPVQEKPKGRKISRKPLTTKSVNTSPEKRKAGDKPEIRKKQKTSPVENEMMPSSVLSPPRRRSRGAQVNYALPSLRTKMRRNRDELVDAVTRSEEGPETNAQTASDLVAEVKMELFNDTDIAADTEIESENPSSRRASTGVTSSRRRSANTRRSLAA